MAYELGNILISKSEIDKRIEEIGSEIAKEYKGKEVIMVGILRGAVIFMSDLVRAVGPEVDVRMDFMSVSSYGDSSVSSGIVKINKDLDSQIESKNVIIVEDIADSGLTLYYLKNLLTGRKPASLKTCALLDKPDRRKVEVDIDYVGFSIPDKFVVGYGLDCGGVWRHLSDIHIVNITQ